MKLNEKALLAAALGLAMAGPSISQAADAAQDDSSALFDQAAAAPAASGDAAPAESTFALGLAGSHEFGYRLPAYDAGSFDYASEMKSPYFDGELGLAVQDKDVKLVSNWDILLRPLAADASNGERGSWDDLARARPLENYVSWSPSGWKLSAGYQVFSWGLADKRNPTDNLNPRDYTVGINADKIPVLAADAIWYPTDSLSIEGVFAPTAQESKYPVDFAAEIPDLLFYGRSLTPPATQLPVVNTRKVSYNALGLEPRNAIAGGKLSYRSSFLDASVSYLYDIDPLYTPVIATAVEPIYVTGTTTPTGYDFTRVSAISLERGRIHRIGFDAKTTLGKFGVWTEACYDLTENSGSDDYAHRKSDLNYVVGTDVSFGPNDTMYCNLQYIGDWIPGFDDSFYKDYANGLPASAKVGDQAYMQEYYQRALVNKLGLQTEGLLQGATVNLKWELADGAITPQVTGAYVLPFLYDDSVETRYGSLALNPEIDLKPVDSFHVKLGADLAYAWVKSAGGGVELDTAKDKVGIYTSSNNVYLQILYKWSYDLKK
jgi:hypothetical protein